jgi:hypothetical protein
MARIFTEGAEFGDMLGWDVATGQITTTRRTGAYALTTSVGGGEYTFQKNFTAVDELFIRMGLRIEYSSTGYMMALRKGSTYIGGIKHDTTFNQLRLYVGNPSGGTLVASGSITFAQQAWYLLEWRLKIADSGGVSQVKIDGVMDMDYTGDTKPGADTTIDNWYTHSGSGWMTCQIDDIGFNTIDNSDGKNDNSWLGDGHIELLKPNGNSPDGGWADQFVGSDGNSTDNYALVDDVPPSASDYVQSETVGQQDRYAITDWTGTGKRIKRVWTEARALDASASGSKLKLGLRVSGADYLSAARVLGGTYGRVLGTEYVLNPATAAQWSDAELNASQSLVEVSA